MFGCAEVLAQETKFVSKKTTIDLIDYFEEYYVLKSDPTFKEGTYVRYRAGWTGVVVLESGNYKNGDKIGLWETYYDPNHSHQRNSIRERGHYANGKRNGLWAFFYLDTLSNQPNTKIYGKKHKPDSINIYIEQGAATVRLAGMYLNDKKVGEWTSFDRKGKLIQKYNFSTGILYDKSIGDSINHYSNRSPLYLGGREQLDFHLHTEIRKSSVFDDLHGAKQDSVAAVATFTIDEMGKVKDILLYHSNAPRKFNAELLRVISTTEYFWIPALRGGKKVEFNTKMTMAVNIKKVEKDYFELHLSFKFNDE